MINKELINEFANIIGNIEIALNFDSYKDVKTDYEIVLNKLLNWLKEYYKNQSLNISSEESLEIYNLLDNIREKILFNKEISDEKLLTDNILVRYEVIIKKINGGKEK